MKIEYAGPRVFSLMHVCLQSNPPVLQKDKLISESKDPNLDNIYYYQNMDGRVCIYISPCTSKSQMMNDKKSRKMCDIPPSILMGNSKYTKYNNSLEERECHTYPCCQTEDTKPDLFMMTLFGTTDEMKFLYNEEYPLRVGCFFEKKNVKLNYEPKRTR